MRMACVHGHLEVVKWLKENGCPPGNNLVFWAIRGGHLELVKWLILNDTHLLDEWDLICAIDNDRPEIMEWLVENGCPLVPWAIASAAQQGSLDVIKYLRQKGCPWDSEAIIEAEESDRPEIAQWLRDNGCPIT